MKKSAIAFIAIVAVIFIVAASFRTAPTAPAPKGIPDSVYMVFEKACITCHADDGNGMAKGKLNFDKWDTYKQDKMASKASDIYFIMKKGNMPPSGFKKSNPNSVPTEADIAKVYAWAKTF